MVLSLSDGFFPSLMVFRKERWWTPMWLRQVPSQPWAFSFWRPMTGIIAAMLGS